MAFAIIVTIITMYSLQMFLVCSEYLYPSRSQAQTRGIVGQRLNGNVGVRWEPSHMSPDPPFREAYFPDKVNWKEEGF